MGSKVAMTERAAVMGTVQTPVPVHAPDHPEKVELGVEVAVKVTEVPLT